MISSPEDFIYQQDTVAYILENESIAREFTENIPNSVMSKPLSGGFTIIYVNYSDLDKIASQATNVTSNMNPTVLGLMDAAMLGEAGIAQVQNHPYLNLKGSGVLLGFIDTGIDYTNSVFHYEDGSSKIKYIWDQTIRGNPPEGYLYGSEFSQEDINRALSSWHPLDIVPHTDTVGHGTFLASVAGGRGSSARMGAAPDSEIIMVKLKRARPFDYSLYLIPLEQENAFSSADIMMGIQYIVDKAFELRRPAAICVSLGTNLHGHDGYSIFELFLSKISSILGMAICAAAGNEQQARHHTHGRIQSTGDSVNIELRASDRFEDINVSIWNNASDRMSVAVTSPTGERIDRLPARPGLNYTHKMILERSVVTVEYRFPIESSGSQLSRIKIMSATPGIWLITLYGDYILDGSYNAWLPITGFIDPNTIFLKSTPDYTIVTPATSSAVITCGAYNSNDSSLSATTSWGPSRQHWILPDLVAPGVNVNGVYPIGYGQMSGTSVSAAITTGASALLLQWGIVEGNDTTLNSTRIRAYLIAGCERDANTAYPNNRWGYGRLNLFNSFQSLRPL